MFLLKNVLMIFSLIFILYFIGMIINYIDYLYRWKWERKIRLEKAEDPKYFFKDENELELKNFYLKKVFPFIFWFRRIKSYHTAFKIAVIAICLIGASNLIAEQAFKSTQIGAFYEQGEYKETYYVYASRENKPEETYKLHALIDAGVDEYIENEDADYDGIFSFGSSKKQYRSYVVSQLFFPNGGSLFFDSGEPVKPFEKASLVDQNDERWIVQLTTQKVE